MANDVAAPAAPSSTDTLTNKVFQGGVMMMGRQLISMGLSLIGLLVITRMIGPAAYGPYVAAIGICTYAQNLGQAGIGIYLVRSAETPNQRTYHVATTILLASACIVTIVIEGGMGLITRWIPMPGLAPLLGVLTFSVILQTVAVSAGARLERALDFRRVAVIETVGQLLYYGSAVPLVFLHFGVWSLVIGYMAQQIYACAAFHIAARYRPRLVWDSNLTKAMLSYTLAYAASDWTWQLRGLVNPVIAGHFLPAAGVGQIGLAIRMLELLSFTKTVAYRLSVAVLAKVQDQPERMTKAITDGVRLQTLALGPVLLGFSWVGSIVLTLLFGARWAPVMTVYPFLAISYLTNANFNLHSSALYVLRRNWDVSWFHIVHIVLFAGSAWLLIGRFGLIGYGYAEAVALLSYPVIARSVKRAIGSPDYGMAAFWWAALAIGFFWRDLGWWAVVAPIAAILSPPSLRQLKTYYAMAVSGRLKLRSRA
jgi:O-antigen/teichoic acid export membrane protein